MMRLMMLMALLLALVVSPAAADSSTCTVVFSTFSRKVEVAMHNNPNIGLYYVFDRSGQALGIAWNNGLEAGFYIQPGHEDTVYTIKDRNMNVAATCGVPTNGAGYTVED